MTNDRYDWDKKTVENTTKNVLDNSTSTTKKEGEIKTYEPNEYEYAELTPQQDRTNYYAQLFGSINPPPEANKDEEDRLRRTAQIQALGDLFKHLGNFAGAGHAPVEKRQENIRLYQTLDKIDANRARVEALANQYKQNRQTYINMMNKADRDAYLQKLKLKQGVMDKNVESANNAKRFDAESHNKNLPTVTTRNNVYKEVKDRRVTIHEVNPNGYTANKGGITYSSARTNLNYDIPENQISNLYSKMVAEGIIPNEKATYIEKFTEGEKRIFGMKQAVASAIDEYDKKYPAKYLNYISKIYTGHQSPVQRFWDNEMQKYAVSAYGNSITPAVYDLGQGAANVQGSGSVASQNSAGTNETAGTVSLNWDDIQ
jgi:hypothetical protein